MCSSASPDDKCIQRRVIDLNGLPASRYADLQEGYESVREALIMSAIL